MSSCETSEPQEPVKSDESGKCQDPKDQVAECTGEGGEGSGDPCTDPSFAGGDPQERYRELCRRTAECKAFYKKLQECNEKVTSKTKTEEKCVEEVIDYFHCVDHCAAKRFFKQLK